MLVGSRVQILEGKSVDESGGRDAVSFGPVHQPNCTQITNFFVFTYNLYPPITERLLIPCDINK